MGTDLQPKESGTNLANIKSDLNVNNEKMHITEKGLGRAFFHDSRYNFKQSLMRFTESTLVL